MRAASCCPDHLGLAACKQRRVLSSSARIERFTPLPKIGPPIPQGSGFVAAPTPPTALEGFRRSPLQPPRGSLLS